MKMLNTLLTFATIGLFATGVRAQEGQDEQNPAPAPEIQLHAHQAYPSHPLEMTVKQQRQLIAMEKAQNRRARIARNAWYGHHPLRPRATSLPFMRSNYVVPAYRYYVPVYIR